MVNPRLRKLVLCVSPSPSGIVIHMILIHFPFFWTSFQNLGFPFFLPQNRYQLGSSLTICLKFLNNLYKWFHSIYIIFIWVLFGCFRVSIFLLFYILPDILIEILRTSLAAPIVAANLLTTIRVLSNLFSCSSFHGWLQVHCSEVRSKFISQIICSVVSVSMSLGKRICYTMCMIFFLPGFVLYAI